MAAKKSVTGFRVAAAAVAFNSMGTGPAVNVIDGGTSIKGDSGVDLEIADLTGEGDVVVKATVTTGTGTPAIANNNIVLTLPTGVAPSKVFISDGASAPKFYVHSIAANVVTIGTKVAPAASTAYTVELICVM